MHFVEAEREGAQPEDEDAPGDKPLSRLKVQTPPQHNGCCFIMYLCLYHPENGRDTDNVISGLYHLVIDHFSLVN